MRSSTWRSLVLVLMVWVFCCGSSRGASGDKVEELVQAGVGLLKTNPAAALVTFEAAEKIRHVTATVYFIAEAHRLLGDKQRARDEFDRYLAEAATGQVKSADARQRLADARSKSAQLSAELAEEARQQERDAMLAAQHAEMERLRAETAAATREAERLAAEAARREVKVERPDEPPASTEGDASAAAASEGPLAAPPTAETSSAVVERVHWYRDTWGWVVTGAGVVLGGVGAGYLVSASNLDREAERGDEALAEDLKDRASTRRWVGGGFLVAGGLVVVAGVVKLAWTDKPKSRRSTGLAVSASFLGVIGTF